MALDIKVVSEKKGLFVVKVNGSLDTATYEQLEKTLNEITNETTKSVVLDFKGLEYISSIGISVLFSAKKTLKAQGAAFALTQLQPQIKYVLDIVKAPSAINVFSNMAEADAYIDQAIQNELERQKVTS